MMLLLNVIYPPQPTHPPANHPTPPVLQPQTDPNTCSKDRLILIETFCRDVINNSRFRRLDALKHTSLYSIRPKLKTSKLKSVSFLPCWWRYVKVVLVHQQHYSATIVLIHVMTERETTINHDFKT